MKLPVDEVLSKYGKIPIKFHSYYKYVFTFTGEDETVKILAHYGGDANDIYRYSITAGKEILFEAFLDSNCDISVIDKATSEEIYYQVKEY